MALNLSRYLVGPWLQPIRFDLRTKLRTIAACTCIALLIPNPGATAQVGGPSFEEARAAIAQQTEQVELGRQYLHNITQKYELARSEDIEQARAYRMLEEQTLRKSNMIKALRAELERAQDQTVRAQIETDIKRHQTEYAQTLEDLEAQRALRVESISSLNSRKSMMEEAQKLAAATEHELSQLTLRYTEIFASAAPPVLSEVEVMDHKGNTVYLGNWRPKEDELRERIALADAIIEDYDHKIAEHHKRIDQWIDFSIEMKEAFEEASKAYQQFFQSFDEDSDWPVHLQFNRYGSGLWKKMGVEGVDRVVSIYNNRSSFGIRGAIIYEGAWSAYDGIAWYNGKVRNPTWDVAFNSAQSRGDWRAIASAIADTAPDSIFAAPSFKKLYNNKPIAKATKGSLIALYRHIRPSKEMQLAELPRLYKAGELAAVFSENMVHGTSPSGILSSPERLVGSRAFTDYWKSPAAIGGAVKRKLFSSSAYTSYARSLLISSLKGAALTTIEQQRLDLMADEHAAYGHSRWAVNRLIAERIMLTQAIEHKQFLIAEREDLRRLLAQQDGDRFVISRNPDTLLAGRETFEVWLTFSRPVIVSDLTIDEKNVEIDKTVSGGQASKVWKGTFDLEGLDEVARISVDAHDDVSQKRLADPRHPPRWNPKTGGFEDYRERPDRHHTLKLDPITEGAATAIVFDTSGSMENDGKLSSAKLVMDRVFERLDQRSSDVFGVYTFDGCSVREAAAIEVGVQKAKEAVAEAQADGDTPLAATIRTATDALLNETSKSDLNLIVVSDGEDTCGGQWQRELDRANRLLTNARMEVVR